MTKMKFLDLKKFTLTEHFKIKKVTRQKKEFIKKKFIYLMY